MPGPKRQHGFWSILLPCLVPAFIVTAFTAYQTAKWRTGQTGEVAAVTTGKPQELAVDAVTSPTLGGPILHPADWEDKCVYDVFQRPPPLVRSRSSLKSLEVTFLNMPERVAGHKTPAKCTDKDEWQVDRIGRPIATPTSMMLKRAIAVGHPHGGLLDPATALPPRPCEKAVPKIMHFLWFCSPVPQRIVQRMMKFALMNPTWKVMILVDNPPQQTEIDLMNSPEVSSRPGGAIIVHYLASYADDFRNMDILRWIRNLSLDPKHLHVCAGMSDVARLEVMFKYGGIYMDTDFLPDRPFADYGDLFRWPFVTHKVCGINIINSILSFDKKSAFLDFALNAYRENCKTFRNCMPEGGAGPPFMAMAILRWNSSEIALIGQQFFHDSRSQIVSHLTENSWGQR